MNYTNVLLFCNEGPELATKLSFTNPHKESPLQLL